MKLLRLYCHLSIVFTVVFIICMIIDDYVFIEKFTSKIIWDDLLWILFIWGINYIVYFFFFFIDLLDDDFIYTFNKGQS